MGRKKCFYYRSNTEQPIKAGGILFVNELDEILVQKDNKYLSDFGGKVDYEDKSIFHTITREFLEEINFGITKVPNNNEILNI